ncbi:MAG: YggT family protein [Bacteriovoracaceae bacterium]
MINAILQIFIYLTIIDAILSYFPELRSKNWYQQLHKIVEVPQKPIKQMLPPGMPLDPSPIIVIIVCQLLMAIF